MLFDIHVHSCYSDGAASPEELVKQAKKLGLSGLAITDHNEVEGAKAALELDLGGFKIIPGIEVSSSDGHILGLGITELVPMGLLAEETVDRIHALGGIAIAAHPYDRLRQGVGDLIYKVAFDAVEVYNGHTIMTSRAPERVLPRLELPVTGGSDAHLLSELGAVVMDFPGDPLEDIVHGRGSITVNISKPRIIYNHIRRRLVKRR